MNIWFPRMPAKRWRATVQITLLGALVAGMYGALHDQISFTISPEYFTKMKFLQFAYANFRWPQRLFASEVGFLGTWWVGLIAGWVLTRAGLAELMEMPKRNYLVRAFAIVIGVGATTGLIGALLGVVKVSGDLKSWTEWQRKLALHDLPEFVIVAYLHAAGYLGGLLGLACAVVYVRLNLAELRKSPRT
jgi:hypothetical protein